MVQRIVTAVGATVSGALIQGVADYLNTLEREETKRQEIWAHHDIIIHALNQERDVILAYFNHTFAERRLVLEQCFDLMDKSIETNDHASLNLALSSILSVIHENPLKDFETFKSRMSEPGFQIVL